MNFGLSDESVGLGAEVVSALPGHALCKEATTYAFHQVPLRYKLKKFTAVCPHGVGAVKGSSFYIVNGFFRCT